MFERIKLAPLSGDELKERIIRKYAGEAEYTRGHAGKTPKNMEEGYSWKLSDDALIPLQYGGSGFPEPLRSDLVGGGLHEPFVEAAILNAMRRPQLRRTAQEIGRVLATPDDVLVATAKEFCEANGMYADLSEPRRQKSQAFRYHQTILATGGEDSKVAYLSELADGWMEERKSELDNVVSKIEARRGTVDLQDFNDLEYYARVIAKLQKSAAHRGEIRGAIPFFVSGALAILEGQNGTLKFRTYRRSEGFYRSEDDLKNVERLSKDILQRTLDAGLSVRKVVEESVGVLVGEEAIVGFN